MVVAPRARPSSPRTEGLVISACPMAARTKVNGSPALERIRTTEIGRHAGEQVLVEGWLRTIRSMGGLTFAVLRDGWGEVQAVWELERDPLRGLGPESVVGLRGMVVPSEQAPGGLELREPAVKRSAP